MIKQSFLDSLIDLPLDVVKEICKASGYETRVMPHGVATILLAFPNTINIWADKVGLRVEAADAGDGLELEED